MKAQLQFSVLFIRKWLEVWAFTASLFIVIPLLMMMIDCFSDGPNIQSNLFIYFHLHSLTFPYVVYYFIYRHGRGFTYIDVCDGGSLYRPDHLRRIGPLRRENDSQHYIIDPVQPAEKVEYVLQRMLEPYIRDGQTSLWLDRRTETLSNVTRLARLACIISSLIGEAPDLIVEYAEHCFNYGVQLDDAIYLLEVSSYK